MASKINSIGSDLLSGRKIKVVVATSVMLSFISFWRAAAIVLNDLGSSAFYVGGIAEQAVGPAAPWFIFGVMLFSYAVRAVYVESCTMFTRGGVYRVVKEAMGGTLAKLSVSALMFDYILTGPISGVSAGQYIVGLVAQTMTYFGHPWAPDKDTINLIAAGLATLVTIYFWRRNTRGVHESSTDALRIMWVVTVMVVIMIGWCALTIATKPETQRLPPSPIPSHLSFNKDAVGWLPDLNPNALVELPKQVFPSDGAVIAAPEAESRFGLIPNAGKLLGLIGILIAFGHSFLAMSGEESLAQVNRELEHPKHANLMKAGLIIFIYSLVFTSLVSFFAYAIIPDHLRAQFSDNLISGIAMYLVGPMALKLLFQGFIVIVGFLMLAGAVNTAIIGANGVLNRVSEDGVLTDWFRAPHPKYGTTYRLINLIAILQIVTIAGSRGNVYILGEAYAFGVIWSFAFKGLAMLVLRYKDRSAREWKVPFNIQLGNWEIPIGLGFVAAAMFAIAGVNLITKQVATVSGIAFTLVFYAIFHISEHINQRKRGSAAHVEVDQFQLAPSDDISSRSLNVKPGNVMCLVRDFQTLAHVTRTVQTVDTHKQDLIVMTVHRLAGPDTGHENIHTSELFTDYEQILFSRVVSIAEKEGKHVELLVVPSTNVFQAIALTASQLKTAEIIVGQSSVFTPDEQAFRIGEAWDEIPDKPNHPVLFKVVGSKGETWSYQLGAHAPVLSEAEVDLIHQAWRELVKQPGLEQIRHKDIVVFSIEKMREDLFNDKNSQILVWIKNRIRKG
ncbi:MAG: APC family permease [Moraxellaceae bacterium]|nr:APC family permease [Pseudobdellovibrionaceae bacterium]